MIARRIVKRITSRAMAVGCLTGAALGAGYGMLLPLVFVAPMLVQAETPRILELAVIFGLYGSLIGLVVGGITGDLAGLALGMSSGLAVGLLTIAHYTPMHDPHEYCWSVRLTSVLITLLCILLVPLVLGRIPRQDSDLFFVGIPLLLTLPCAWRAGARLADWYLTQLDKPVEPAPA
ncbi:MAG TPA: hypothetical protein VGD58_23195 [Herpetosiphonaceae bacterium]